MVVLRRTIYFLVDISFPFDIHAHSPCQSTSSSTRWTPPIHSLFSGSSAAYYVRHELAPLWYFSNLSVEYVQVKPILAAVTLVLKATGKYGDGDFRSDKGYLYVTVVYNISICIALYSLAMFWVVIHDDVKPFRPMPKFLCIKGTWSFFHSDIQIDFRPQVSCFSVSGKESPFLSLSKSEPLPTVYSHLIYLESSSPFLSRPVHGQRAHRPSNI
jgi:hypothetical protein